MTAAEKASVSALRATVCASVMAVTAQLQKAAPVLGTDERGLALTAVEHLDAAAETLMILLDALDGVQRKEKENVFD